MLVTLKEVLADADSRGYAVPAFNINNLEILQSVISAAEESSSPIIVQTSEGAIAYAGMEMLIAMVNVAGKKSRVPIVLHLDHGKNRGLISSAIKNGYTSVMFDGSLLPFEQNIAETSDVVREAHEKGVSVEAELGAIKGMEDLVSVSDKQVFMTDPTQAVDFVSRTGCDALAVSIGTAHGAYKFHGDIMLDIDRLSEIDRSVNVPLVLHGASGVGAELVSKVEKMCSSFGDCGRLSGAVGVPDEMVRRAVENGVRKVNIDTDLRIAWTAGVRESLLSQTKEIDPRKLLELSKNLMKEVALHKMEMLGSSGKA